MLDCVTIIYIRIPPLMHGVYSEQIFHTEHHGLLTVTRVSVQELLMGKKKLKSALILMFALASTCT